MAEAKYCIECGAKLFDESVGVSSKKPEEALRPQRLYDLLAEWSAVEKKSQFSFGGLVATHTEPESIYVMRYGITVKANKTVVLRTGKISYGSGCLDSTPWRTAFYDESYSDRIDGLMNALEKAISFEENRF